MHGNVVVVVGQLRLRTRHFHRLKNPSEDKNPFSDVLLSLRRNRDDWNLVVRHPECRRTKSIWSRKPNWKSRRKSSSIDRRANEMVWSESLVSLEWNEGEKLLKVNNVESDQSRKMTHLPVFVLDWINQTRQISVNITTRRTNDDVYQIKSNSFGGGWGLWLMTSHDRGRC